MRAFFKYLIVAYLIYLVIKYFGKLFSGGIAPQGKNNQGSNQRNGSTNIKNPAPKDKKHVSGGEYVDFEEVE